MGSFWRAFCSTQARFENPGFIGDPGAGRTSAAATCVGVLASGLEMGMLLIASSPIRRGERRMKPRIGPFRHAPVDGRTSDATLSRSLATETSGPIV
ncbi:MAG: hypothetical protein CBB77_08900 [Hyphomonas sp. TMED17]|nr:MAG: hypothetical protein CBB77_08900 [Hyphomonas sp. TMED17]